MTYQFDREKIDRIILGENFDPNMQMPVSEPQDISSHPGIKYFLHRYCRILTKNADEIMGWVESADWLGLQLILNEDISGPKVQRAIIFWDNVNGLEELAVKKSTT